MFWLAGHFKLKQQGKQAKKMFVKCDMKNQNQGPLMGQKSVASKKQDHMWFENRS